MAPSMSAGEDSKKEEQGSKPVHPRVVFALCLLGGPLGYLLFGKSEAAAASMVFLVIAGLSYWLWPAFFPAFIGSAFWVLAVAGKRWALARQRISHPAFLRMPGFPRRAGPFLAPLIIDFGFICLAEIFLKQVCIELERVHVMAVVLSLCLTLPVCLAVTLSLRDAMLARVYR